EIMHRPKNRQLRGNRTKEARQIEPSSHPMQVNNRRQRAERPQWSPPHPARTSHESTWSASSCAPAGGDSSGISPKERPVFKDRHCAFIHCVAAAEVEARVDTRTAEREVKPLSGDTSAPSEICGEMRNHD